MVKYVSSFRNKRESHRFLVGKRYHRSEYKYEALASVSDLRHTIVSVFPEPQFKIVRSNWKKTVLRGISWLIGVISRRIPLL